MLMNRLYMPEYDADTDREVLPLDDPLCDMSMLSEMQAMLVLLGSILIDVYVEYAGCQATV